VHALQPPVHAVSQHTPSAQKPLWHSFAADAWHIVPFATFGRHCPVPMLQYWPAAHEASFAQSPEHTSPAHDLGAHEVVPLLMHEPAPSQVFASVFVIPVQVCAEHGVPEG